MKTILENPHAVLAIVTAIGVIVAAVGVIVAIVTFIIRDTHTRRIRKSEAYQRLELASIDLFKFEVRHSDIAWRLYDENFDITKATKQEKREVLNHVTQLLNLFELSIELHSRKIFEHKILATWLAWFFETAKFKTFRDMWGDKASKNEEDLCKHYTGDLGELVELAIKIIDDVKIAKEDKFDKFKEKLCEMKKYKPLAPYL